jgi:hypothetical protein
MATPIKVLRVLATAVLDTVAEAGPAGAPSGPMYLALNQRGLSLADYEALMALLVRAGLLRKRATSTSARASDRQRAAGRRYQ